MSKDANEEHDYHLKFPKDLFDELRVVAEANRRTVKAELLIATELRIAAHKQQSELQRLISR